MEEFHTDAIRDFATNQILQRLGGDNNLTNAILEEYLGNLSSFFQEKVEKFNLEDLNELFEMNQSGLDLIAGLTWTELKDEIIDPDSEFPSACYQLEMFKRVTMANFERLARRLEQDQRMINSFFLDQEEDTPLQLQRIIPTGSDYHNYGNQVFLLEFLVDDETKIIVYKPSPMLLDAMIFGDLESLHGMQELYHEINGDNLSDEAIFENRSISEIINQGLDGDAFTPTYKILPFFDNHQLNEELEIDEADFMTDVTRHYGYSEYIQREKHPVNSLNLQNLTEEIRERIESGDYAHQIIDLRNYNGNQISDFIKQLSYQYGLQTAVMFSTGLVDMHNENGIAVVERDQEGNLIPKLHLIDGEISFNASERNLDQTSCFLPWGGLMCQRNFSKEKNQILFFDGDYLDTIPLSRKHIKKGMKKGLKILKSNKQILQKWFNDIRDCEIPFRILPQETGYLEGSLLETNNFSFSRRTVKGVLDLEELRDNFDSEVLHHLNMESPQFILFLRDQDRQALLDEYMCFGIPTCYAIGNQLYFSSGLKLENFADIQISLADFLTQNENLTGDEREVFLANYLEIADIDLQNPSDLVQLSEGKIFGILNDLNNFIDQNVIDYNVIKSVFGSDYGDYKETSQACSVCIIQ